MSFIQNIELSWSDWKTLQASSSFSSASVYYLQNDLQYVPFLVSASTSDAQNAEYLYYVNVNRDPSSVNGPYAALSTGTKATIDIQSSITYTATFYGTAGNSITIEYVNDATAVGKEYVTVSDNAITVHIVDGQSTAQQVQVAVNGWNSYSGLSSYNSSVSSYLVIAVVDANQAGTIQVTQAPTNLVGGVDTLTVLSDWETNFKSSALLVGSFMDGVAQFTALP